MKKPAETSQAALLLAGFLVLVIPLAFFNSLLNAAMERTRESAMGLLREEILQTAERIKDHCRPGVYVREVIKKVHQKLLPEVRPELIKMFPAKNFGQEEFSSELPQKFLQALRKEGLDAIQILAFAPEYENAFYWHCEELQKQCREETSLVNKQALVHYAAAARLSKAGLRKPSCWITWPRTRQARKETRQEAASICGAGSRLNIQVGATKSISPGCPAIPKCKPACQISIG
ncbi:MAG TPA: hypothetical protein PLR50_03835 [Candidatus Rifleibacterium sp.]|nr:hypothetical protein [Candidatus Rifleibacterium sp.]